MNAGFVDMKQLKRERQGKWEVIAGIVTPAARAVIDEDQGGLVISLMFSEIVGGLETDLRISFGRVPAYTVYEEFIHPWDGGDPPKLSGKWKSYAYPLLRIEDSGWIKSLAKQLVVHPDCMHLRLVTLDQIVDVLCAQSPKAGWVNELSLNSANLAT